MPSYHHLGDIPPKRHTQFRQPDGSLYAEELFGTEGFTGNYSILYYHGSPTRVKRIEQARANANLYTVHEAWNEGVQRHHHFKTAALTRGGDAVLGRQALMFNQDVVIGVAKPEKAMEYFYRDGEADLLYFVHNGHGVLETNFGLLPYHKGDYIVIPRGTTSASNLLPIAQIPPSWSLKLMVAIEPPSRYQNKNGQLLEHAPYCERDIRRPEELATHTKTGEFEVRLKSRSYDYQLLV